MSLTNLKRTLYFAKYNLRPFRPRLAIRHTAKRLLSAMSLKTGYRIIDLALTYDCNLNCCHCSAATLKTDAKHSLSLADYQVIVEQAKLLDVLSFNITGGEPLLSPILYDLIAILEPRRHYLSLQTNCMLMDRTTATQLARAGINCITTSLDSLDFIEHNRFRGHDDSFRKVFEGIGNAKSAGMQVLIAGTITHQNLRTSKLVELIEEANRHGAIFLFNLATPSGRWSGQEDVLFKEGDRSYLESLLARYPMTSTDHEVGRNGKGCPAGIEKCYITVAGDVLPCPFIHLSFGNIRQESLVRIVHRMQRLDYFGKYQNLCLAAEDKAFQKKIMAEIAAREVPGPVAYQEIIGPLQNDEPVV